MSGSKKRSPEDHFKHLRKLLELEEAEERERFTQEFVQLTPEERQAKGKALLYLVAAELHYSPGGHRLVTLRYDNRKPLPVYSPDLGDVVSLTDNPNLFSDFPVGTVYEKTRDDIVIAFNEELPDWLEEGGICHLYLAGGKITYRKMLRALSEVQKAEHNRLAYFRDLSLGLKKPAQNDPIPILQIPFFNSQLNPYQKEAVQTALQAQDVALIHGPPGTGKTTVLLEIIQQTVAKDKKVFATAPSNTACDHLLECFVSHGLKVLRLGHPARIMKHLREHTLDFKLMHHPYVKQVNELQTQLHRLYVWKDRRNDRGRGLAREDRQQVSEEARELKRQVRELENNILSQVLSQASVIVGTHASATDSALRDKKFDLLVMDEATQGIEPSAWIPILRAEKLILAGDPCQLPPTVLSQKAQEQGLGTTLFERFYSILEPEFKSLLRIQYRMHENIMTFSSRHFYQGALIADDSVKTHTLLDLSHVKRNAQTEAVLLFLDTAGRGFEETVESGKESRYNLEEAQLVLKELKGLLESQVKPQEIAVISPYSAQVRLLASQIQNEKIEIDTVDGFQGREKEAVIISLVRSNVKGEMGFLTDLRRMNVAMTRARRKLIVIGDSATISNIPFYQDFIQYAESINAYRSSWEDISAS